MPRCFADTPSARRSRIWLSLAVVLAIGSVQILADAPPGRKADSEPASPDLPQRLYVARSPEGGWRAWTERAGRRIEVEIPQKTDELPRFAEQHRYVLIWHAEQQADEPGGEHSPSVKTPHRPAGSRPTAVGSEPARLPDAAQQARPATGGAASSSEAPTSTPPTPAEQITRLQRTIEADQQRRDEFQAALNEPMGEYQRAEAAFREVEHKLEQQKAAVQRLRDEQRDAEVVDAEARLVELETKRKLARERFDLAIHARQVQQEKIVSLDEKLRQNRAALDRLAMRPQAPEPGEPVADKRPGNAAAQVAGSGGAPAGKADAVATTASSTSDLSAGEAKAKLGSTDAPAADAPQAATAAASPDPLEPAEAVPATVTASSAAAGSDTVQPAAAASAGRTQAPSAELVEAQRDAQSKGAAAREAEQEAESLSERVLVLDRNIELQQRLLENVRNRRDNANQSRLQLEEEHRRKLREGIPPADLRDLLDQIDEAERRFMATTDEVRDGAEQLDAMQSERAALQSEALAALTQAANKRRAADAADLRVQEIQNPFTLRNVLQWSLDHGPRLLLIVLGMFLLKLVMRAGTRRLVAVLARSGARGTREEREDRARTLVGVFHSTGSVAIIVGGTLMICDEIGIAVAPLMGGAAVIGLAVAFGAQNLIRDYFYGFVILLENQYKINDVVKIGDIAGQVERITLRVTVLRDLEGRVHFIPNGRIDSVTNMTHGWSRALFEIGVAYKEDADRVMEVLLDLARDLRRDPTFGPLILDDAEMLGLDSFGDSSINIKFFIKTRPLKQWTVKRELLRRIKRKFDDLGVEIPFPHRTVYHRQSDESPAREFESPELGREAA